MIDSIVALCIKMLLIKLVMSNWNWDMETWPKLTRNGIFGSLAENKYVIAWIILSDWNPALFRATNLYEPIILTQFWWRLHHEVSFQSVNWAQSGVYNWMTWRKFLFDSPDNKKKQNEGWQSEWNYIRKSSILAQCNYICNTVMPKPIGLYNI